MTTAKTPRGYTLIELIVAIGIFSIIMLLATGAYLSLVSYTRQARATSLVMTNLSFAMDAMTRDLRTGTGYQCGAFGDCPNGGSAITFTDDQGREMTYILLNGALARCVNAAICTSSNAVPVTDPAITVTSLMFYVRGTGTRAGGDYVQPNVVVVIKGKASPGSGAVPVTFSLETSATQRLIDL